MNNNSIRAAKRHECGLYKGGNGFSFRDFNLDRRLTDSNGHILNGSPNRTHEKSEKDVKENECDSTSESI